jgi:hypothetical protein
MGLAFTSKPIIMDTISASPATFLTDLHAMLLAAGWTAATYLTGHVYACESPQNLAVQVRIWNPSDPNFAGCAAFQWVSSVTPNPEGLIHHLYMDVDTTHTVWINCCSLFIARTGISHRSFPHLPVSVCGGIPYAAGLTTPTPQCEAQSPSAAEETTELWFSSGGDSGVALFGAPTLESFRSGHICKRFSFCRNGVISSYPEVLEQDALQLGIFRPAGYASPIGGATVFLPGGIRFTDNTPMAGDPLLWLRGHIYGQLYDACLLSVQMDLEATEEIYETEGDRTTHWVNHSTGDTNVLFRPDDGTLFSLLLLTGIPGSGTVVENVAY